ncbi:MAG: orotidine-5'-phosphate decarboxylase, partial [Vicinamibacterales bacterium]
MDQHLRERILVALDVDARADALQLADAVRGSVGGFKIGSRLFTGAGPDVVRALVDRGDRVFLDLKFHDIPNTVAGAVAAASDLGVWMLNVHAAGGTAMMQAARDAAQASAARRRAQPPLVIAVTVLTSMNQTSLRDTGIVIDLMDHVLRLAESTREAGLD